MKRVFLLVVTALCLMPFSSCEKDYNIYVYEYLYVAFVSENGETLMNKLPTTSDSQSGEIETKYYKFGNYGSPLEYTTVDGVKYFDLTLFDPMGHIKYSMEYTLSCKRLFDDYDTHVMTANFKKLPGEKYELVCVRFTFDGVEFPVSPEGYVTVTVPSAVQ